MTEMITIKKICPECEKPSEATVPKEGYNSWMAGEFIQVAMPNVSADDREILMTGIHGPCYDKMFDFDEDEAEYEDDEDDTDETPEGPICDAGFS